MYILELCKVYNEIMIELLQDRTIPNSGYIKKICADFAYFNECLLANSNRVYVLYQVYLYQYYTIAAHAAFSSNNLIKPEASPPDSKDAVKAQKFDFHSEVYKLNTQFVKNLINECLQNADKKQRRRIELMMNTMLSAFAPRNNVFSNTSILDEFYKSNGMTLLLGMRSLLEDLRESGSIFRISVPDKKSFSVGKNIANTEGIVVFENKYMQLIYYKPLSETSYTTPVLIVPPWINRFYVFDLDDKHSMVKWLLEKGYSVFAISWANPDTEMQDKGFDEYLENGPLKAMEMVKSIIGTTHVHIIGYCVSSTMITALLSLLESRNDKSIKSATLLAAAIDFGEIGDVSAFLDEDGVNIIESIIAKQGYISGEQLNMFFTALRVSDMIWRFITNYLSGKKQDPMSILYWNSDSVRVTGALHSFFMREFYLKNKLVHPGALSVLSSPIDIEKISTPVYCVGTVDDYIVPWRSAYSGYKLIGSKNKRFVLTGSGHVLGIMNHPGKNKYFYFCNKDDDSLSSDEWYDTSTKVAGSWWIDWIKWLDNLSGDTRCPQNYNSTLSIEPAPGRYATMY